MDTIAVTGGNGRLGGAIIEELDERGYHTVNVSRGERREDVADAYRRTDLLDPGEVYGSLAASDADAVVHMGTVPAPTGNPGYVTFESNAMSSYHVLEAATELGLDAACLASSVNVLGAAYQDAPTEVRYLPVDEDHPVTPRDPYALGKHSTEVTCDGFGRLPDAPCVTSLRYPWVATGAELRSRFTESDRSLDAIDAEDARDNLFTYVHVADAARIARLAIEAEFDGHETFWAVADDTTVEAPSAELARRFYADADRRGELVGHESLVSIDKARRLLDWEPEHSWRSL